MERGAWAWAWQGFPSAGLTSHRSLAELSEAHCREESERDAVMRTELWLQAQAPDTFPPWLCPADLVADADLLPIRTGFQPLPQALKALCTLDPVFSHPYYAAATLCSVSQPSRVRCPAPGWDALYPSRAILIPPYPRKLSLNPPAVPDHSMVYSEALPELESYSAPV